MAIISLDDMKKQLKITSLVAVDKEMLEGLIAGVEAATKKYCGQTFESAVVDEYIDGSGLREMTVTRVPITAIEQIDSVASDDIETEIESDDYRYRANSGIFFHKNGRWANGFQNYRFRYTAGYSEADMPEDLKFAIRTWVLALWNKYQQKLIGVSSMRLGDENISYSFDAIPKEVTEMLKKYKRGAYA